MTVWHRICFTYGQLEFSKTSVVDKAKPRAIVGRKATGPSGIAGLPKQKEFCRPVVPIVTRAIFFKPRPAWKVMEYQCQSLMGVHFIGFRKTSA